jgi:hypothetical protein
VLVSSHPQAPARYKDVADHRKQKKKRESNEIKLGSKIFADKRNKENNTAVCLTRDSKQEKWVNTNCYEVSQNGKRKLDFKIKIFERKN